MGYRSAETAVRERIAAVEREIAELDAEIATRGTELGAIAKTTAQLRERIEREGPGGGRQGAAILRIPLIVGFMLVLGVLALQGQFFIAHGLHRSPEETVIPYMILTGPVLVGLAVACRYRKVAKVYRALGFAGGLLLVAVVVLFGVGLAGLLDVRY